MLEMLFTAAPSTDVVKDLQDKVISLQDHEVAFLNTTISNMLTAVGIGVAIIIAIAGGAFAYVSYSNNRAQKKMIEAEVKMVEASEKLEEAKSEISDLEERNTRLEKKISEANDILINARSIATVAQDKLTELEKEQKEILITTLRLEANAMYSFALGHQQGEIDRAIKNINDLTISGYPFFTDRRLTLNTELYDLDMRLRSLKKVFAMSMVDESSISNRVDQLEGFNNDFNRVMSDFRSLEEDISKGDPLDSEQ
ncbi:spbB protein [Bacillus sp. FSL E2-0195]|uniref:spbB protein n=1 Tax=Bacillus sp. FSL E2-0195 TaxID=2921363 RepID=UPI0030F73299